MMYIEFSRSSSEHFQICYQQDTNIKGKWSSFTIEGLPTNLYPHTLSYPDFARLAAQSQETYLKLKNLISVLFTKDVGRLIYQTKAIESFSELTFCEYLQPVAERIKQESLIWFGASSFQVSSAPDLLEGL